ncbi:hypothetical protein BD309DRAFT_554985 [Dichomitus squalens]|nr:hypothetical protein BD309DRAFT_554985 [Dichomitus squalens]
MYVEFVHLVFSYTNLLIGACVWLSPPGSDGRVLAPSRNAPPYPALTWGNYGLWPQRARVMQYRTRCGRKPLTATQTVPVPPRRSTHRSPSLPSMAVLPRSTFDGRVNRIWSDPLEHSDYGLMRLHQSISLTLLGVDRKALNLQDYSIRLDAPNPNNLDMHSLTMSTSSSLFTSSVCRQAKRRGASVYCWPLASTWSHRVRRRLAHMRERTRTVCCGMARPPSGERQALGLDTRRANVALTTPSGVPLTLCLN